MIVSNDIKLDFSDVLIVPKVSEGIESRSEVSLVREFSFNNGAEWAGVPIIAANMTNVGTFSMARALVNHDMLTAVHKHYPTEEMKENFDVECSFYTIGTSISDFERMVEVGAEPYSDLQFICVDIANGGLSILRDTVIRVRESFPLAIIMAGNVATSDGVKSLLDLGVDIVKVGIGSGATCLTRSVTGVGYPQFSAILDCQALMEEYPKQYICSDGGITCPGDLAKAFAAGADFVMMGSTLAGHYESEGEVIGDTEVILDPSIYQTLTEAMHCKGYVYKGIEYCSIAELPEEAYTIRYKKGAKMKFYGMSSHTAQDKFSGGTPDYRTSEGRDEILMPFKGHVQDTLKTYLGGVRSACTYVGVCNLEQMPSHSTFVRVNNQLNRSLELYEKG